MKSVLSILLLACTSVLASPPQRVTILYDMSRNGSGMAEVSETLEHNGKTYSISSEVHGKGLFALMGVLKRTSSGRIDANGLQPVEFRDQRGNRPPVTAKFDWTRRIVVQENDGKSESLALPAAAQDPLSMTYTLAFVSSPGKEMRVTRADGKGLTPFRFAVLGIEKLQTPLGELQALHIAKERDGPEDKSTDIWLASDRSLLPIRILVVEKDGTRIDQVVTRIGS